MLGTGNMMHMPLLISSILTHAVENNPEQEIVTALDNGELHRYSYLEFAHRVQDLALGLRREGLQPGERVASREEYLTDLAVLPSGASLVLQAGKRTLTLKADDLEHYKGERGRRGNKLPRGFQRVDQLLVE